MAVFAFFLLAAAVWVPLIFWRRMSQGWRYAAMIVFGMAIVTYHYHPTERACERANVCDDSGY